MSTVMTLTDANFDEELKKITVPVLVDFWAPWCGPCKSVGPILEEVSQDYAGRLVVAKVNVDENQIIAARYGVRSIPNMVILKEGQEVGRIVGARPKSDFKTILDPLV